MILEDFRELIEQVIFDENDGAPASIVNSQDDETVDTNEDDILIDFGNNENQGGAEDAEAESHLSFADVFGAEIEYLFEDEADVREYFAANNVSNNNNVTEATEAATSPNDVGNNNKEIEAISSTNNVRNNNNELNENNAYGLFDPDNESIQPVDVQPSRLQNNFEPFRRVENAPSGRCRHRSLYRPIFIFSDHN